MVVSDFVKLYWTFWMTPFAVIGMMWGSNIEQMQQHWISEAASKARIRAMEADRFERKVWSGKE